MSKKWLLSLGLAGSVFVVTACGGASEPEAVPETQQEEPTADASGAPEAPVPDLEGLPDVVAEVNGTEILSEEFITVYEGQFQQSAMQSQMSGQEVDQDQLKNQTVEGMIGNELLIQEADNRGIEPSSEAIDEALNQLVESNQLESAEEFMAALAEQGMDEAEVNAQLETQVQVDQLITEEAGDTKPTEEELNTAYEQAKTQQEQMGEAGGQATEIPSFEEARPGLEQQLSEQEEAAAAQALVDDLREQADVEIHL